MITIFIVSVVEDLHRVTYELGPEGNNVLDLVSEGDGPRLHCSTWKKTLN